jgi:hypothetical protein
MANHDHVIRQVGLALEPLAEPDQFGGAVPALTASTSPTPIASITA